MNIAVLGNQSKQSGAVLMLSLILIIVLTLIGITAMKTSTFEERMAFNLQDSNLAFQAAESALREAERTINAKTALPHELPCPDLADGGCSSIEVLIGSSTAFDDVDDFRSMSYASWLANGQGIASPVDGTAANARYIIREVRFVPDSLNIGHGVPPGRYLYEITAVGVGETDRAEKVLQSTFLRRY
jgi:type IV pilus assembly protein PilX